MVTHKAYYTLLLLGLLLAACSAPSGPVPSLAVPTASTQPSATVTATAQPTTTLTAIPSATSTATRKPEAAPTRTPTPSRTYVTLRGEVIVEQAVCHYGPGAPYLYKYGVYKGSHLEIIARVLYGNYIEVRAIGGTNPCWVREDYMQVEGDLANVQSIPAEDVKLPPSPYYGPLTGVSASREGDTVSVFWNPLVLKAGDSSEQTPYIVEAWVCQNGQFVFKPVGTYDTAVKIVDEPGCAQTSHADVVGAEKHGYTRRVEVAWP